MRSRQRGLTVSLRPSRQPVATTSSRRCLRCRTSITLITPGSPMTSGVFVMQPSARLSGGPLPRGAVPTASPTRARNRRYGYRNCAGWISPAANRVTPRPARSPTGCRPGSGAMPKPPRRQPTSTGRKGPCASATTARAGAPRYRMPSSSPTGCSWQSIRYLVPHGFFYTTHALKKHDAPPTFFYLVMPFCPLGSSRPTWSASPEP